MDSVTEDVEHVEATPAGGLEEVPADLAVVLTGAVDLARAAIEEFSGDDVVGEYLGASFDDPTAATHRFLAVVSGYQGWQWAVVVAAYPGSERATVSEVVLVPGPTALLAPAWVPWQERIRPGDLSPGDLLSPSADDPRLVPGFLGSGDPDLDEVANEVGFGRRQVLSQWGRLETAQRWFDSDYGPDSAMARSTRRVCRDCGFYLPLAGPLGPSFGACANEMSADGHVVAGEYGCGAHSDTPAPATIGSPMFDPFDDGVLDVAEQRVEQPTEPVAEQPTEPVAEQPAEPVAEQPAEPVAEQSAEPDSEQPVAE